MYIPSVLYRMYSQQCYSVILSTKGKATPQVGAWDTMWYECLCFGDIGPVNFGCLLKQSDFEEYLTILCTCRVVVRGCFWLMTSFRLILKSSNVGLWMLGSLLVLVLSMCIASSFGQKAGSMPVFCLYHSFRREDLGPCSFYRWLFFQWCKVVFTFFEKAIYWVGTVSAWVAKT